MKKRRLIISWLGLALFFGAFQIIGEATYSKQDNPDQARQRPGFITNQIEKAPMIGGVVYSKRPTVFIFDRQFSDTNLFHEQSILTTQANVILVSNSANNLKLADGIKKIIYDPNQEIKTSFSLSVPSDGGYPIGYVIVDSDGYIRFRTLDPGYKNRDEILIMLGALK